MDKFILEINDFLPKDFCQYIIKNFESDKNKEKGIMKYYVDGKFLTRSKYNTEINLAKHENWKDINRLLQEFIGEACKQYIKNLKNEFDYDQEHHMFDKELCLFSENESIILDNIIIQKIKRGDKYIWHHDGALDRPTFIQVILYLNTLNEDEGGCTEFIDGKKVRPEAGKVLIYPASWVFPHRGNTVEADHKYICTCITYVNLGKC